MCLQQRSQRRHRSAILNSAVERDWPGLVRVQGEKQTEGERRDRETKGRRVRDVEREPTALSDQHARTDSGSLPPQDYVSSSSLLTSSHVTPGPIQHWVRGCWSDTQTCLQRSNTHAHLTWMFNPNDRYLSLTNRYRGHWFSACRSYDIFKQSKVFLHVKKDFPYFIGIFSTVLKNYKHPAINKKSKD